MGSAAAELGCGGGGGEARVSGRQRVELGRMYGPAHAHAERGVRTAHAGEGAWVGVFYFYI